MPSDPSASFAVQAGVQPLRPIALPQLLQRGGELELTVHQRLSELEHAEPVQGWIRLRHDGSTLVVEGEASTTLGCRCDRCLSSFQLPLLARAHERLALDQGGSPAGDGGPPEALILSGWLEGEGSLDLRASLGEEPEERLDPHGVFDPEHWLFEQLSLQLPLVYRCGPDCPGPDRWSSASDMPDGRWQALRQLRPDGA